MEGFAWPPAVHAKVRRPDRLWRFRRLVNNGSRAQARISAATWLQNSSRQ